LSPLETWTYNASSVALTSAPGVDETHVVTATGDSESRTATDTDTVVYFGMAASMSLDKTTTGANDDGDYSGPGDDILIAAGDDVTWTYRVTNIGNVPLSGIAVNDDREGAVSCASGSVAPGDSVDCSATGVAETSLGTAIFDTTNPSGYSYTNGYSNSATASGTHAPTSTPVSSNSDRRSPAPRSCDRDGFPDPPPKSLDRALRAARCETSPRSPRYPDPRPSGPCTK
jgi:uncharacterized repeat protein (TIGR01451 family)